MKEYNEKDLLLAQAKVVNKIMFHLCVAMGETKNQSEFDLIYKEWEYVSGICNEIIKKAEEKNV